MEALNRVDKVTKSNLIEVVDSVSSEISKYYGSRQVLSLTTKFLWLKHRTPIRIYDRQARIALKTQDGDYKAFNEAFTKKLSLAKHDVRNACEKLAEVQLFSAASEMDPALIRELVKKPWFQERVLDIYLWNEGS